jgi:hypothetical protein
MWLTTRPVLPFRVFGSAYRSAPSNGHTRATRHASRTVASGPSFFFFFFFPLPRESDPPSPFSTAMCYTILCMLLSIAPARTEPGHHMIPHMCTRSKITVLCPGYFLLALGGGGVGWTLPQVLLTWETSGLGTLEDLSRDEPPSPKLGPPKMKKDVRA